MSDRSGRNSLLPRPTIGTILQTMAWVAAGTAAGVAVFFFVLDASRGVRNGVWSACLSGRSSRMALDARAHHAVYETGTDRTLYWTALTDSDGVPLDRRRHYRIVSGALPARFWSLTLYDGENRLLPNEWGRYSVTSLDVSKQPDGSFAIDVSPRLISGAANWIATAPSPRDDTRFLAYLRLYDIDPTAGRDPASLPLPAIVRMPD
jgi:hypothetical protein